MDELFKDAAELAVSHGQINTSLIQRKLKIGYNRACRIIDQLKLAGIIVAPKGIGNHKCLVKDTIQLEEILHKIDI